MEANWLKVKSSLIRLVKRALDEGGFTLPDAAREVIFTRGVPVQLERTHAEMAHTSNQQKRFRPHKKQRL